MALSVQRHMVLIKRLLHRGSSVFPSVYILKVIFLWMENITTAALNMCVSV